MGQILNQYSALWLAAALVVVITVALVRHHRPTLRDFLAVGILAAGLFIAWLSLHPTQTPLMEDAQKVQAMIGQGQPVLLEFQSPYCLACTQMKPVVDRLEQELQGRVLFIRLNVQEEAGRELAALYGFQYTPTFIYLDAQGNEVWREVGRLNVQRVRDSLE